MQSIDIMWPTIVIVLLLVIGNGLRRSLARVIMVRYDIFLDIFLSQRCSIVTHRILLLRLGFIARSRCPLTSYYEPQAVQHIVRF